MTAIIKKKKIITLPQKADKGIYKILTILKFNKKLPKILVCLFC